jgi:hypothetical protein
MGVIVRLHENITRTLLILSLAISFFILPVASQIKELHGIRFPEKYKIEGDPTRSIQNETQNNIVSPGTFGTLTDEFLINSGCGEYGADQGYANIASGSKGGFLCAWNDERIGDRQVNAQLFDSLGNKIGTVIQVSHGNSNWNSEPHIVFNNTTNEYIVLWAGTGYEIYFQRISELGEKIGNNIMANEYYRTNTNNPGAAIDSSGNIIVTWVADVTCCMNERPYCRIFDKTGNPLTSQWALDNSISSIGWEDRIAADSLGRCIIVWSNHTGTRSQIFLQSVSRSGNLFDAPLVVSDPNDSTAHFFPSVTGTRNGYFLILWSNDHGICGRIFSADSGFITSQFVVAQFPNYWLTAGSSSDDANKFYIMYFADHPYGQIISTSGQLLGGQKQLSYSSPVSWARYPKLSKIQPDRFFSVYWGYVRSQTDVMLQAFDPTFNPLGNSLKVADDDCSAWQTKPVVQYNQSGQALAVWEDARNGYNHLYGQVLSVLGDPVGPNLLISDSVNIQWASKPAITSDKTGNFLVTFAGGSYSDRNLWLQNITSSGQLDGSNRLISNGHYYDYDNLNSIIHRDQDGNILISWFENYYLVVYTRSFYPSLNGRTFKTEIFRSTVTSPKEVLSVESNDNFHILVTWIDKNNEVGASQDLKAIILNERGEIIQDTMVINRLSANHSYQTCSAQIDNHDNLLIAWTDYQSWGYGCRLHIKRCYSRNLWSREDSIYVSIENRIQAVKFENRKSLVAWSSYGYVNSFFSEDIIRPITQLSPEKSTFTRLGKSCDAFGTDIFNNHIFFVFESIKNPEKGCDIYGKIQETEQTFMVRSSSSAEELMKVYPNPSTESATLEYKIQSPTYVMISVYNILGQEIAKLESGVKSTGVYNVQFLTHNLNTGIYFFRYQGATTQCIKFIVIR